MKLMEKLGYYRQHWFVRNVATLQAGSFAGTFIQAISGVLIARMLQPELFGVYSLAFGMASLGGLLLGAGTQEAVSSLLGSAYAENKKDEIKEILAFLLKMTLYSGLITALILIFFPTLSDYFYSDSSVGRFASIIVVAVFISSSFNAAVQLSLQVVGKIKTLTAIVLSDQFFRFGLSVLFVFFGFGILGGVGGHVIGASIIFIISIFLWEQLKKQYSIFPSLRSLARELYLVSIKKYFGFSFWVAVDRNMGNLYMALPVVLTGIFVSSGEVSFFRLAFGYINIVLSLLGPISVLLNIEFPKMRVEDSAKMASNFIKVSLYGMGLSTLLTLGAVLSAPFAFKILYGESFTPSVNYVFGLLAYGALFGIGVGLGPMWRAINKVKVSILINTIILGAGIPLGLILIKNYGAWGSIIMVTLWFTFSHFASFIYLSRNLKFRNQK